MSANTYEALNAKVGRRSFLKMAAVSTAFGVTSLQLHLPLLIQRKF